MDRRRGWDFHEGAEVGERCRSEHVLDRRNVAYPYSTEPTRLVKSAATALVRRERGYFQDLEIWVRNRATEETLVELR